MTLKKSLQKSEANPLQPKVILAVGAHPDDIDIGCSGTVAKLTKEGGAAYYLVLTDGSKGSEDLKISNKKLIKIRKSEERGKTKLDWLDSKHGFSFGRYYNQDNMLLRCILIHI